MTMLECKISSLWLIEMLKNPVRNILVSCSSGVYELTHNTRSIIYIWMSYG